MKYPFKIKPYEHQLTALEKGLPHLEYAYFMEMGTGKTKVLLDTAAVLYDQGKIEGLLVVAPKGVYRNWTDIEIPAHFPDHIPSRVVAWSSNLNKKKKEEINSLFEPNNNFCIFVINVDALITKKGALVIEKFLNTRLAMMVIDESTTIKTPSAKRTKATIKFGKLARYRRILTGSPVTKSPLDIYTQCEFLNPHLLGFSSYYSFRNRYAVLIDQDYGGRTFKQVVGYKNTEELKDELAQFSFRVTKDECLDLPPKIYVRREFEMTKEQKKVYDEMLSLALAIFEEGAATTTSAIVQLLRLHQISCGFLPLDDDGGMQELKNDRLSTLMQLLEETDEKVIIWANYRADIFRIKEAVEKAYGPDSIVTYFGDTNIDDRQTAVSSFQDMSSSTRFFLGNTQTGGYGITLTAASTVVYYSNNYDLEKRLQSEDRAHRIGQHNPVTYIDLVCKNTVDEKIIKALRNKIDLARAITGDKWREWL
jgi:SNF2 family DNA or RNA helicase|tara:strand:- start:5666 stop:7102 length:1437 start_codon:yes stop_codon:yes gene_type:complete